MSNYDDTYSPIPCAEYSRYEVAILHQQRLRIAWRDRGHLHHLHILLPLDLQTKESEEFLIAVDEEEKQHSIRLDRISQCQSVENLS